MNTEYINTDLREAILEDMVERTACSWIADLSITNAVVRLKGLMPWQLNFLLNHGGVVAVDNVEDLEKNRYQDTFLTKSEEPTLLEWMTQRRSYLRNNRTPGTMLPILIIA